MSPKPSRRQSRRERTVAPALRPSNWRARRWRIWRWRRAGWALAVGLLAVAAAAVYGYRIHAVRRPAPVRVPVVVRALPHDHEAFTQGLIYADGVFYESTGLVGRSSLRRVDVETGRVTQRIDVAAKVFAEGLASVGNQLIQLTWQNGEAFVYDQATFEKKGTFRYEGEGWGLAFDGRRLILSDGTATLRFLDPVTHVVQDTLAVTDAGLAVARLNELEMMDGDLYANIWQTGRIARISLRTGRVIEWLDLSDLVAKVQRANPQADVLNGIAWDAQGQRLFVTGKLWPNVYEIR